MYADDLALCGELEEGPEVMMGRFVEMCRKRGFKINIGKSKVIVLNVVEGLECEVYVDVIR